MVTDERFARRVEEAVTRAEALTSAELVVVAAPSSGSYVDVALGAALSAVGVALLVAFYSPIAFHPDWLPLELAVVGGAFGLLTWRSAVLTRLLTRRSRRRAQVELAAAAAFHQEQVHATRERTGVLFYVSALERELVVIHDHGVDARVAPGAWASLHLEARDLDGLCASIERAGALLGAHLTRTHDDVNELPDAPVMR